MTFLTAYKIFSALLLLFFVLLLWPLNAASRRVRREIQELAAHAHQDAAPDRSSRIHSGCSPHGSCSRRYRS